MFFPICKYIRYLFFIYNKILRSFFFFFNCIKGTALNSLAGQIWPAGHMFDKKKKGSIGCKDKTDSKVIYYLDRER